MPPVPQNMCSGPQVNHGPVGHVIAEQRDERRAAPLPDELQQIVPAATNDHRAGGRRRCKRCCDGAPRAAKCGQISHTPIINQ